MLTVDGIPTKEDLNKVFPSEERMLKGAVAIAECFQQIPCNPCTKACVKKAIRVEPDINETPKVDTDVCNGCGACLLRCPGLAIFIVDKSYSETEALVKLPFEFLPVPQKGQFVEGLARDGQPLGWFEVERVVNGGKTNQTNMISLIVPQNLALEVRNIRVGGYRDGRE